MTYGIARRVMVAGLVTLGVGVAPEPLEAQVRRESRRGYTGFVAAGVSGIAMGELNDRLAGGGYPTFRTKPLALNLGAYRLLRSGVMLGGEWHYLNLGDGHEQQASREVGLGAGYATLGIGYAVELSPRVRVYPRLGLGAGGMGLWTEEDDEGGAVDFDQWLAAPLTDRDHSTLSQASMVVDLGAGAEFLLSSRRGALIGLRAGYVAAPFDQGWTRDGRSVSGAPQTTVAGPYVRVVMGWRRER